MPKGVYKRRGRPGLSHEQKKYNKRSGRLQLEFGITAKEYDDFHNFCKGVCGICNLPEVALDRRGGVKKLAIDHDHKTGIIRGLLCQQCNMGLGKFKDNVEFLKNAATYLESYKEALKEHHATSTR